MKQRILKFTVQNQRIITADTSVVADSRNYLSAHFCFDKTWEGVAKTAVFSQGDNVYNVLLEDDMCRIPAEVIKPDAFYVSVFGGDLITADKIRVEVAPSGLITGVVPPVPTPDIYNQLIERVERESADAAASAEQAVFAAQMAEDFSKNSEIYASVCEASVGPVMNAEQSATNSMVEAEHAAAAAGESATAAQGSAEAAYSCYLDAESAAARAGLSAERLKNKTLCSGILSEGTSVAVIKAEISEDISNIRDFGFLLEFPLSKTFSAGSVWISAVLVDEDESKYNISLYSNQNQAISSTANNAVAVGFGRVMECGGRMQYMGVSQQVTNYSGTNSRTTTASVTAEYKQSLFSQYPPYLKITVSAACPFTAGTRWSLEGR